MSEARKWSGFRLAVAWVGAAGSVALIRGGLYAGVYRSTVEGVHVVHLGGVWPRSFASIMTAVFAAITLFAVGWATRDWVRGRRHRAARRVSRTARYRKVIM
jgi:hypothetical protein